MFWLQGPALPAVACFAEKHVSCSGAAGPEAPNGSGAPQRTRHYMNDCGLPWRVRGSRDDASLPADDLEAQPGSSFGLLWLKVLKVTSN